MVSQNGKDTNRMNEFSQIEKLIDKRAYEDAITQCNVLIKESVETNIQVLRLRAKASALKGLLIQSISDFESIFSSNNGSIQDYYLAAYYALEANELKKSEDWFQDVVKLGRINSENWFESATHFYLAYIQFKFAQYSDAKTNIELAIQTEPDIELPVPGHKMLLGRLLRELISTKLID